MKTPISFSSISIFVLVLFSAMTGQAQVVWQGGAPGQETDWNQPMNWSAHYVPDMDDAVIIPDRSTHGNFYPVIDTETSPIASLVVEGQATLTIAPTGKLLVDGSDTYNDGILLIGYLVNEGALVIKDVALSAVAGYPEHLQSSGEMMVIRSSKSNVQPTKKAPQSYSWEPFGGKTSME